MCTICLSRFPYPYQLVRHQKTSCDLSKRRFLFQKPIVRNIPIEAQLKHEIPDIELSKDGNFLFISIIKNAGRYTVEIVESNSRHQLSLISDNIASLAKAVTNLAHQLTGNWKASRLVKNNIVILFIIASLTKQASVSVVFLC